MLASNDASEPGSSFESCSLVSPAHELVTELDASDKLLESHSELDATEFRELMSRWEFSPSSVPPLPNPVDEDTSYKPDDSSVEPGSECSLKRELCRLD